MVLLAATQATTAITSTPDMVSEMGFGIYGAEGLNTSTAICFRIKRYSSQEVYGIFSI